MPNYRIHGLTVQTDIELPALIHEPSGKVDLRVRLGPVRRVSNRRPRGTLMAHAIFDGGVGFAHVRTRQGYLLRYFSRCEAALSSGIDEIELHLDPRCSGPAWSSLFLAGGIFAFLLSLRGEVPIHASAVKYGGRTLAFAGSSGAGKSTLAALFCTQGAQLLADDLLVINDAGMAHVGAQELRLRPAAGALAGWFAPGHRTTSVDGRTVVAAAQAPPEAAPVSALIAPVLIEGTPDIQMRRLSGSQAFLAVATAPRQLGIVDTQMQRQQFGKLARLVNCLPVIEARIPLARLRQPEMAVELFDKIQRELVR